MSRLVALSVIAATCHFTPSALSAQGAVDPRMPVRAAELVRQGERGVATDMLGGYLAVAPDDGHAWLQLGRIYVLGSREWHLAHSGQPDAPLLLEFAATAFEQASRLAIDSGAVLRAQVEVERALLLFEEGGWDGSRAAAIGVRRAPLPPELAELGRNLIISCPRGGVLLTGGELEAVVSWHAALSSTDRHDLVVIRPDLYATDPVYRAMAAQTLDVDPALPVRAAVAAAAATRPICLSPGTDEAAVPSTPWYAARLVRVSRPDVSLDDALSVTDAITADRGRASPWLPVIRSVYAAAARHNTMLCPVLLPIFGDVPPAACRS
jgi:hypothetical protein